MNMSNNTNDNFTNMLNTMYAENNLHIHNLIQQNNLIINALLNMSTTTNNARRNRHNTSLTHPITNSIPIINSNTNPITNLYSNTNTNPNRQYIIDNHIQTRTIPSRNRINDIFSNFLEPIVVNPTQSQIEIATRRVRYCDILTPTNTSCPISLDNFNDNDMVTIIRFCGHIFNTEHLNTWFQSNCRCPICRYDIRRYNSTSHTSNTNNTPTTNNSVQNTTSEINLERNNIINLLEDLSGNLIFESFDPNIILNVFDALQSIRR